MRIGRFDVPPTTAAFGGSAIAIVVLSLLLVMRQAGAALPPESAHRFSGSEVIQRMPSVLPAAHLPRRVPVVVVRDASAASYYDSPAILDSVVARWRDALLAVGADVRIVPSDSLDTAARDARVLVIPDSPCLSLATDEAIARVRAAGGGMIVTGPAAVNDAACRPLGLGFVVGTSGASRAELLGGRDMVYVTVPAGGPLAMDVPPGARLDLRPAHQVALRALGRDAFYSDYALQPLPAHGMPLVDGAMTHDVVGRARTVYWGFDLGDAVRLPWTEEILRLLVRNSVAWAAGEPLGTVEPWPHGRRAAAAIAQDVEAGFADARVALDTLRALHVRSTYFVISNLAQRNPELSRAFPAAGEIGSHTENHRLIGGQPAAVQLARLERTQHDLTGLLGRSVLGLRPPEEQFDRNTMAAWRAAGGTYIFGANDSRSAAPELFDVGGARASAPRGAPRDPLVLLGRAGGDDFAVLASARGQGTDTVAATFLDEYRRFRALGGMYVLSYHSQNLVRPELLGGLVRTARAIAADTSVWLATTGQIADWWRRRAQLVVGVTGDPARALTVVVHNDGPRAVAGAVVRVSTGAEVPPVEASAPLLPAPAGFVRVALPAIPAGGTRAFALSWARPQPAAAPSRQRIVRRRPVRLRGRARRRLSGWRALVPWWP